ncbi:hypothetical protein DB31_2838 [Hyalangium minutum]|uniref:Glycosyltransferase RgtA/B/C/D-like domain-containing protein n=1 Tax=Hyalangium minutum TaxID=394096 RepID=A0A085W6D2_9BACT|nr:hypothetical protein DB31_2838 [Hyalangium minutum]
MQSWHKALAWSVALAFVGITLARLYPDSYQQDGGAHYALTRWAFDHPWFFVKVWARPLFEAVYAVPAQWGQPVAKLVTVAVCLATGWHTFRLAEQLGLARPHLAIPLVWFQPSWLLLCSEMMTEPLFALVFVLALRLHLAGRVVAGLWTASLLILARPEGFFLGILWGLWILLDRRDPQPLWKRLPSTLRLAAGFGLWWLASVAITGNPLFILDDWPRDWDATNGAYGTEPFWSYALRLPEIVGPLFAIPFLLGLGLLLFRRQLGTLTSSFLLFFLLHSVFRTLGVFGEAGYPRYFVSVAPAMALITLIGWNTITGKLSLPLFTGTLGALGLGASAAAAFIYVDAAESSRDAWAIDATLARFRESPREVLRIHASHRYMYAVLDYDPKLAPAFTADREHNQKVLREAPAGTLVVWEDHIGPSWYHLEEKDIEALGYTLLRSDTSVLTGKWLKDSPGLFFDYGSGVLTRERSSWPGFGGPRTVRVSLLYKEH